MMSPTINAYAMLDHMIITNMIGDSAAPSILL
ncbi:hypothetical protein PE36_09211 [Moritella sp. PE36]|nr:hypothetical protein PE36_09211 [Moritella sp. PE36]